MTLDEVREWFAYDSETGVLRWRKRRCNRAKADLSIGTNSNGYVSACYNGKNYLGHRIAWAIHYGAFPTRPIDHINGNRSDNRIVNLRQVSFAENQKNTCLDKRNRSGVSGVRYRASRGKWEATIRSDYKHHYLGLFENFTDAVEARMDAERKFGFHQNHGRMNYLSEAAE